MNTLDKQQKLFTAYVRNPNEQSLPFGIDSERMELYAELVYDGVEDFLATSFPVLHSLLKKKHWKMLVRDFCIKHRSKSPLFRDIPAEFLDYLENEREKNAIDPPFMLELAHYEWVEIALLTSNDIIDSSTLNVTGDLFTGIPLLSPLAWLLAYDFPVHQISKRNQPKQPGSIPTYLLVYRNKLDKVKFMQLNARSAKLVSLISESHELTGMEILLQFATALQLEENGSIIQEIKKLLAMLREEDIILGTKIGKGSDGPYMSC